MEKLDSPVLHHVSHARRVPMAERFFSCEFTCEFCGWLAERVHATRMALSRRLATCKGQRLFVRHCVRDLVCGGQWTTLEQLRRGTTWTRIVDIASSRGHWTHGHRLVATGPTTHGLVQRHSRRVEDQAPRADCGMATCLFHTVPHGWRRRLEGDTNRRSGDPSVHASSADHA